MEKFNKDALPGGFNLRGEEIKGKEAELKEAEERKNENVDGEEIPSASSSENFSNILAGISDTIDEGNENKEKIEGLQRRIGYLNKLDEKALGDVHEFAMKENELRDEITEVLNKIKENPESENISEDIEKAQDLISELKSFENPKISKYYDEEGTKNLREKFGNLYRGIQSLIEGKAKVRLEDGNYAFIDRDGNLQEGRYGYAEGYSEGKARVKLVYGKWGYIDQDGNFIEE